MKIIVTPAYYGVPTIRELAGFVAAELSSNSYDHGRLEDMSDSLDKVRDAFGRLVETLVEHGRLGLSTVPAIVGTSDKIEKTAP